MAKPQFHRNSDRAAGFTLLELLIAMAILAALAGLMAGSLSFGATVWSKSDAVAERTEQSIIAQRFLRRMLGEAQPLVHADTRRDRLLAFDGRRAELKFVTGSLSHAAIGGPYLVYVHLIGSGSDKSLAISWRELAPDLEDFDTSKDQETSVLMNGVSDLEITYFGKLTSGDDRQWQSSWENRKQLPLLVRIKLQFDRPNDHAWPEFVASTHVQSTSMR